MSTLHIQIISIDIGTGVTKTKKAYEFLDIIYKNKSYQDKVENKKIMPFSNKEVLDVLKHANKGDVFYITREKNDQGFWEWTNVESTPQEEQQTSLPAVQNKPIQNAYEQEKAQTQLYIIRQSSLTNAVNTLTSGIDPTEVKKTAQVYIDFVLGADNKFEPIETPFDNEYDD